MVEQEEVLGEFQVELQDEVLQECYFVFQEEVFKVLDEVLKEF